MSRWGDRVCRPATEEEIERLTETLKTLYRERGAAAVAEVLRHGAALLSEKGQPDEIVQEFRDLADRVDAVGAESGT